MFEIDFGGSQNTGHESGNSLLVAPNRTASAFGKRSDAARPARTYATQMEALKRYCTGGEQKVTVHHVSVNEGGQAIVGNVNQAASGTAPEKPVTTPALTDARQQAMPIIETTPAQVVPLRTKKNDGG
jgi:hypothetical protein